MASEDGCIIMHDARAESQFTRAQGILQHDAEFTSVQYHPTMPHIFATSDNRGEICLRDSRMAFGPLSRRSRQGIVQTVGLVVQCISKHLMKNAVRDDIVEAVPSLPQQS